MIRTSMHSLSSCLLACISIVGALAVIAPAYGTIITFNLDFEFSQGAAPEFSPATQTNPWLRATFDDEDPNLPADSVRLTMSAPNLTGGGEFVNNWNFNLDPAFDANDLVFSAPHSKVGALDEGAIVASTDNTNANSDFQANGDGFFDIMFMFSIQNGKSNKLGSGDAISFDISGIVGLDANSFNFLSFMDGGQGSFQTAAQIGGIGEDDLSGWIAPIPEPTSGMLLLAGCFVGGLFAGRRKRRR